MIKNLPTLILIFISTIVCAQTCPCPSVHVAVFSFDNYQLTPPWYTQGDVIQTPKYTKMQEYEYDTWFMSSKRGAQGFYNKAIEKNGQIRFSFVNDYPDSSLKNVPVDVDYFVWGWYEGDSSHVTLHVFIEDPHTKQIIGDATSNLELLDGTTTMLSRLADATGAGEETAFKLTPVLQSLQDRRYQLRDSLNNGTAVHALFEIEAAETKLRLKDSTEIQLHLFDCDGSPLKNRQVLLQLSKGECKLQPNTVTTNENGDAVAKFFAGKKPEKIMVIPVYQYTPITGKKTAAATCIAPLVITVGDTLQQVVKNDLSGKKIKWHITVTYDEKVSRANKSASIESSGEFTKSGTVDMIMIADGPDENGYIMINTENGKPVSVKVTGDVVDKSESKQKYLDGFEYRKDEYFGKAEEDNIGFDFEYDPSNGGPKAVVTGIYYNKKGHYTLKRTASEDSRSWDNPEDDDYGAYQATIGRSDDVIKRLSNGFVIDGGEMINKEEDGLYAGHTSEKGYIRYHITIIRI